MTPSRAKRPARRPTDVPPIAPSDTDDHAAELRVIIGKGIAVMHVEINVLSEPPPGGGPISADSVDRIMAITAKASEIRGQVVRADAHVTRKKLTLPMIEKGIADLTPDERESLIERFGGGGAKSVLS